MHALYPTFIFVEYNFIATQATAFDRFWIETYWNQYNLICWYHTGPILRNLHKDR